MAAQDERGGDGLLGGRCPLSTSLPGSVQSRRRLRYAGHVTQQQGTRGGGRRRRDYPAAAANGRSGEPASPSTTDFF